MKKPIIFSFQTLLIVIIGGVILSGEVWAFSLNVDPPSVKISARAGGSTTGVIKAQNRGDMPLVVRVYVEDWEFVKDGSSKKFSPIGTSEYSSGDWINVFPEEFELAPGEKKEVQFTFVLPENAIGGYYGVIFFETSLGSGETNEGVSVDFAGRLGVITYLETEGKILRDGRVSELSATPPTASSPLEIKINFENTGNTYIIADGIVNVIDLEGNIYLNESTKKLNTLPGDMVEQIVSWPGTLDEGEYDVILTLEMSDGSIIVKESKLFVPGE